MACKLKFPHSFWKLQVLRVPMSDLFNFLCLLIHFEIFTSVHQRSTHLWGQKKNTQQNKKEKKNKQTTTTTNDSEKWKERRKASMLS